MMGKAKKGAGSIKNKRVGSCPKEFEGGAYTAVARNAKFAGNKAYDL